MDYFLPLSQSQSLIRNLPADGRLTDELERALAHEEMLSNTSLVAPLPDLFGALKRAVQRLSFGRKQEGLQHA